MEARPSRMIPVPAVLALAALFLAAVPVVAGCNEWTSGGPWGGNIQSIAVSPQDPSVLYAAVWARGIYKSADSGETWFEVNNGLYYWDGVGLYPTTVAVDPQRPNIVYTAISRIGIFKSTDGGESWILGSDGMHDDPYVYNVVFDPRDTDVLYTGAGYAYKSLDGGRSWFRIMEGLITTVGDLAIDPSHPDTLYAATSNGVYKTENGGASWWRCSDGLPSGGSGYLAIDPQIPSTLYVRSERDGEFKSTDGGASWFPINNGLPPWIYSFAIDPVTTSTLYAGTWGYGVFRSEDGGASWAPINTGISYYLHFHTDALVVDPLRPSTLYAGLGGVYPESSGGLFKSTDGGETWFSSATGIAHMSSVAVAADPFEPGTLYTAVWDCGIFKSEDSGASWEFRRTEPNEGGWYALALDPFAPGTLYAGTGGGIFKSADGAQTWRLISDGLEIWVLRLAADRQTPGTLYAGGAGGEVFKSTDFGESWVDASKGLPMPGQIWTLAVDPSDSTVVYAGTWADPGSGGLFQSMDAGCNWTQLNPQFTSPTAVAIDSCTPTTLYEGDYAGIAKSTDGGATWIICDEGISDPTILSLAIVKNDNQTLVAGTYQTGAFRSTDGARFWASFNSGLPSTSGYYGYYFKVYSIHPDPWTPGRVLAATDTGVYSLEQAFLAGDCDRNENISIGEVQRATNMFLHLAPPACGVDRSGDGEVSIGEMQGVINGFLGLVDPCAP